MADLDLVKSIMVGPTYDIIPKTKILLIKGPDLINATYGR